MVKLIGIIYSLWGLFNICFISYGIWAFGAEGKMGVLSLPKVIEDFLSVFFRTITPFVCIGNEMNTTIFFNYILHIAFLISGIALLFTKKWGCKLLLLCIIVSFIIFLVNYFYFYYGGDKTFLVLIPLAIYLATVVYLVRCL